MKRHQETLSAHYLHIAKWKKPVWKATYSMIPTKEKVKLWR